MRSWPLLECLGVTVVAVAFGWSPIPAIAQLPASQSAATKTVSTTPRIGDALLHTLLALQKTRAPMTLLGISKFVGESHSLNVNSNRTLIAYNNAVAVERGGRYTPLPAMRSDVLVVSCGDPDLGQIFNCTRLALKTATGRIVKPLTIRQGPQAYRNALGARWTARTISATYDVRDLRDGFTVDYAADDGTEWTLPVSAEEANRDLLLTINLQTGDADECAIRGRC